MRRFGLIGYPLEHSFSQKYFTNKFALEKITDCVYDLFPIHEIHELHTIFETHPDLCGLNVTIPYKQLVLRHLNSTINIPQGVRACNCIKVVDGKLIGYNTDVVGFEKSLTPLLKPCHTKALILGHGGSSVAVAFVLEKLGIEFLIVSREIHDHANITYADLNGSIVGSHKLIINTTPLGMFPKTKESPEVPYKFLTAEHLCYDLIYNPSTTQFLKQAEEFGARIKNGEEMLRLQAEESWAIWNK